MDVRVAVCVTEFLSARSDRLHLIFCMITSLFWVVLQFIFSWSCKRPCFTNMSCHNHCVQQNNKEIRHFHSIFGADAIVFRSVMQGRPTLANKLIDRERFSVKFYLRQRESFLSLHHQNQREIRRMYVENWKCEVICLPRAELWQSEEICTLKYSISNWL